MERAGGVEMNYLRLVSLKGGVPLADSRMMAEKCGVDHRSLYRLIQVHAESIEGAFGTVRREITPSAAKGGGGDGQRFALLTEDQATFLITLTRNTPQVIAFKSALVKAFSEAKRQLADRISAPALPQTYLEALKALTHEVEAKERLSLQNATLTREVEQMQPKAEFFDVAMNARNGMLVRDAAKLLGNSVPGGIGERRLFKWLRANSWLTTDNRPYQDRVDSGQMTLTERPIVTHSHGTIISVTPRITQKGLVLLYRRIVGMSKQDANRAVFGEEVTA